MALSTLKAFWENQPVYLDAKEPTLKTMESNPIKTEADYFLVLSEIETLMMAEADTPEGERLDILVTLVEAYERKHYALDLPDPI